MRGIHLLALLPALSARPLPTQAISWSPDPVRRAGLRRPWRRMMADAGALDCTASLATDEATPANERWEPVPDTLSTSCNAVCGGAHVAVAEGLEAVDGASLCVYRDFAQTYCSEDSVDSCVSGSSCSYDCLATAADATSWVIEWLAAETTGADPPVLVTSQSRDGAAQSAVVHGSAQQFAQQFTIPDGLERFEISGPKTTPPSDLELSDDMLSGLQFLQELYLHHVSLSSWTAIPDMPTLTTLSLVDTALTTWPLENLPRSLEVLALDGNTAIKSDQVAVPDSLQSLSMNDCELQSVPRAIKTASGLKELSLNGNSLGDGTSSSVFPSSLMALSLRDCGLEAIPTDISRMKALESLDLSENPELRRLEGPTFPSSLRSLRLSACDLAAFPSAELQDLRLTLLDVSLNLLDSSELSDELGGFADDLITLNLAATGLSSVPSAIASMSKLTTLSMSENALDSVDASLLPPALTYLNIAGNPDLTLDESIAQRTALVTLNVSGCSLTSLPSLTALTQLDTLDASHNALTTVSSSFLPSDRGSLRQLNISYNSLATIPSAVFALPYLQRLDLTGNPIASGSLAVTSAELAFLRGLTVLRVDAAVFNSSCSSPATLMGTFSVCVDENADTNRTDNPSVPQDRAPLGGDNGSNVGLITGCIAGAMVVLTIGSVVLRRWRRQSGTSKSVDAGGYGFSPGYGFGDDRYEYDSALPGLVSDQQRAMSASDWRGLEFWRFWDNPEIQALRIPWDLVRSREVVGSGASGSVLWLAQLHGRTVFLKSLQPSAHANHARHGATSVAAASPEQEAPVDEAAATAAASVTAMLREVQVLRHLRHEAVVQLMGVTWLNNPTDVQVVFEDMRHGDLRTYLDELVPAHPDHAGFAQAPVVVMPTPPTTRWQYDGFSMRIAQQIADALVYLHELTPRAVVHCDLRSRNVLLDLDSGTAKLGGFGRHRFVTSVLDSRRTVAATPDGARAIRRPVAGSKAQTESDDHSDPDHAPAGSLPDRAVPVPAAPALDETDPTTFLDAGRWMAPELLRGEVTPQSLTAVDVYSFGMFLLELDTFLPPFACNRFSDLELDSNEEDEQDEEDQSKAGRPGRPRPASAAQDPDVDPEVRREAALLQRVMRGEQAIELPSSCPMGIGDLILRCVAADPEARPSIREVRDSLVAFAEFSNPNGQSVDQRQSRSQSQGQGQSWGQSQSQRSGRLPLSQRALVPSGGDQGEERRNSSFFVLAQSPCATLSS